MILTIHNLAKAYSVLPSEALQRATTFDLHVLDINSRWNKYQQEQQEKGQHNTIAPKSKQYTQESLQAMIDRVKNKERK